MIVASRGSDLEFLRSYMNWDEGVGVCCWKAPSRTKLEALFQKVGTPFDSMIAVEEHVAESLVT
ncbi:MAG: DUF4242 domain-containing protein [Planctomycetes bacterium]|nr:DUF4242 domain-containing protein [Planctomycetota bacterium]